MQSSRSLSNDVGHRFRESLSLQSIASIKSKTWLVGAQLWIDFYLVHDRFHSMGHIFDQAISWEFESLCFDSLVFDGLPSLAVVQRIGSDRYFFDLRRPKPQASGGAKGKTPLLPLLGENAYRKSPSVTDRARATPDGTNRFAPSIKRTALIRLHLFQLADETW
jgi:hypothetical protein